MNGTGPRPPVRLETKKPAMKVPAIPIPMVCGIDNGSRPGSASRANAPTIKPKMASEMMKASSDTRTYYPLMPLPRP